MKNTILLTAILLLGFTTLSNAQEPLSFRSNALGGIIDDDLDLVYDPIELRFVDGIRLYTNLSNLTSGNEQIFNDYSDDEFLIGISSQNPLMKFLWHSMLIKFQNATSSNYIEIDSDLNGWSDYSGYGQLNDEYTAYLDTNYDGLYDLKNMLSQQKSDFTNDDSYSLVSNNTLNMFGLTLGAKLSLGDATYTGNSASSNLGSGDGVLSSINFDIPTFAREIYTQTVGYSFNNNGYSLVWLEGGDFSSENRVNFRNIDVSVMLPKFLEFELRGDVLIYTNQNRSTVNDIYDGEYEYFDPDISNYTETYSESDTYQSETDENGGGVVVGGSLLKTFNEQNERKNDGFWKVGLSMNLGSYEYVNSSSSQFSSTEVNYDGALSSDDFVKTISEKSSNTDEGTKKLIGYNVYGRFNIPLGENVYFGLGGYYNQSSSMRNTDYSESQNDVTDYDYTDSAYYQSDYVTTESSQLTADRNYDIHISTFSFPVGLEYKIGNKRNWSLRFGSIFTNTHQTIDDSKQIEDSTPYVSETEYGDGDVSINIDNNTYNSTSEQIRSASSSTLFTYGIGYNPTDNLQVDILGFLNNSDDLLISSSFFRELRFSFTIKF